MSKLKVLLVEDSATFRSILMTLGEDKAAFSVCESLAEATQAVANERFDMVLLDLHLPDGNSIEFCRNYKSQLANADTFVVFLSGEAGLEWRLRAYEAGAEDFIRKNVLREELDVKMESLFSFQSQRLASLRELKAQAETLITENYHVQVDNNAIMAFFKDCVKIRSLEQLESSLVSVFLNWQLHYIARITVDDGSTIYFKNNGEVACAMEQELFDELGANSSNVQSFGASSYFKSTNVELIIKNMPIDNDSNYSRLIDLFHMLTDVIQHRWQEIEHINRIESISQQLAAVNEQYGNVELMEPIHDLALQVQALKAADAAEADATDSEITFF